jgi:hypothetical protein
MLALRSLQRFWQTDSRRWHVGLPNPRNWLSYLEDIFLEGVVVLHETIHELKRKKAERSYSQTRF